MCTLIVQWNPGADVPLRVGANRDERPERQSEPFAFRNGILCPLDVRGGTWIGVNNHGVFSALTNLDRNEPADRGRHSRGILVLEALRQGSAAAGVTKVVGMMLENIYNAFNLLIADRERMIAVVGHGSTRRVELVHFSPGLHVVTGWGVDNWKIPRAKWIKDYFEEIRPHQGQINLGDAVGEMEHALTYHSPDGSAKSSTCIHSVYNPNESHVTISSCIIEIASKVDDLASCPPWHKVTVLHTEKPSCQTDYWNRAVMYCEDR